MAVGLMGSIAAATLVPAGGAGAITTTTTVVPGAAGDAAPVPAAAPVGPTTLSRVSETGAPSTPTVGVAPTGTAGSPPTYTWPELHRTPTLAGDSPDPALSTANAASLGVSWMTNTGAPNLGSPVVAWNARDAATLVYTSNANGQLTAYDQATGLPVWSDTFTSHMTSTPVVDGAFIWAAPADAKRLYKLDAGTGAAVCSAPLPYTTYASPTVATPPGGQPTVYMGVNDFGSHNGPLVAVDATTCAVDFSVTPEPAPGTGGIWDAVGYGVDATGVGLVLFGTADPDAAVYAVNAVTGATVWRYATDNPVPHVYDVGAGITISAPGVNGFAGGAAYVVNKYGALDALDLTTGAVYWSAKTQGAIGTPALAGTSLVVATETGGGTVTCFNARTGAVEWTDAIGVGFDGAPAIVGPPGSALVVDGDLGGTVRVLSLATGATLYTYQTSTNYIATGPAEVDGNIVVTGGDGWVYDFAPGGGNGAAPTTTMVAPANGSTVGNPHGLLTLSGTATASASGPVGAVTVAIQKGGSTGQWWDSASRSWVGAPFPNPASIQPTGSGASWTLALPVTTSGGVFEAFASAVGANGLADIAASGSAPSTARSSFTVRPIWSAPSLHASVYWVAPGGNVEVSGKNFTPGASVHVTLGGATLATLAVKATGNLPNHKVRVPATGTFGPGALEAFDPSTGATASAPLYVTSSWTDQGQGALHHAYEPDDSVFTSHQPINWTFTSVWSFASPAPVDGSPVVGDATVFLADTSGTVTAVGIQTAMQRWQAVVGGGSPITVTPALDERTSAGLLVVGNQAGALVALDASTGSVLWHTTLGSPVTAAPVIAGGTVYAGTRSGAIEAVSEATGAVIWRSTLSSAVTRAPAVAVTAKVVLVGDSAGELAALNTATGAVRWQLSTGTASIVTDPLVYAGYVFVGTGAGDVLAVNDKTGVVRWTETTSGISASMALYGTTVLVGKSNGAVVGLSTVTGAQTSVIAYHNAVTGIAATVRFTLVETGSGALIGYKQPGPGKGKWSVTLGSPGLGEPVLHDGLIFAVDGSGALECYTVPGAIPY